jgi:hypothetical protein
MILTEFFSSLGFAILVRKALDAGLNYCIAFGSIRRKSTIFILSANCLTNVDLAVALGIFLFDIYIFGALRNLKLECITHIYC